MRLPLELGQMTQKAQIIQYLEEGGHTGRWIAQQLGCSEVYVSQVKKAWKKTKQQQPVFPDPVPDELPYTPSGYYVETADLQTIFEAAQRIVRGRWESRGTAKSYGYTILKLIRKIRGENY